MATELKITPATASRMFLTSNGKVPICVSISMKALNQLTEKLR